MYSNNSTFFYVYIATTAITEHLYWSKSTVRSMDATKIDIASTTESNAQCTVTSKICFQFIFVYIIYKFYTYVVLIHLNNFYPKTGHW